MKARPPDAIEIVRVARVGLAEELAIDAPVRVAPGQDGERATLGRKHPQATALLRQQPAHRLGCRVVGHQPRRRRSPAPDALDRERTELVLERAPFDVVLGSGRALTQVLGPLLVHAAHSGHREHLDRPS